VLRDLGVALVDLAQRQRGKAIVRFYDEPWEMCVERLGATAALSVYRSGRAPEIGVYDVRVPFIDVLGGVRDAIEGMLAGAKGAVSLELTSTLAALERPACDSEDDVSDPAPVSVEIDDAAPISVGADFVMRGAASDIPQIVERTDLHALLFRGRMRAEVRGRPVDLGEGHPFLFAERLLDLGARALAAWEHGQAMAVREAAGGVMVGVRLGMGGQMALTLASGGIDANYTFPALAVTDVVEAAIGFGKSLVRAIVRRDRSQAQNLRLSAFRRRLREVQALAREAARDDAVINPAPESYRAFAESVRPPDVAPSPAPRRLRYSARWRAIVPGIDLRATFLCGDRLIVGGAAETFCLERTTGEPIWRAETRRATSVPTPAGIARLHPDGELKLHDLGTGQVSMRTRLQARVGGPPAGVVVHTPTLPRLLIVTEGERHLVAIDLTSGEPRWRFAWGAGGSLRLRRAGRLLYLACGDSTLTALDVATGDMVWRARDRLRFRGAPALDHDMLFAVAGGTSGATHLHALCAFSGEQKWMAQVPEHGRSCTVEGLPLVSGRHVVLLIRERQGLVLHAYDRESGELAWATPAPVAPSGTSWLALEGLIVGNAPTGEIVGICAATGRIRYRHVLGRVLEADVPRRLEPVLRSGALYVPHVDVHVLRPSDGAHLCTIGPCDAIPDLLRVDERCDVYVAEESGHVASFGAGPRLELVR
jgi:outer membrane protein assembly factor BamB